jgi:uncharacterized membrane protein
METPNEKRSNESRESTRNQGTGSSNSGRSGSTGGLGAGAAGGTGSAGGIGGVSDHSRSSGTTTGSKGSIGSSINTGDTGSASRTTLNRSTESGDGENGILSSLGIKKNQLLSAIGAIVGGALLYKGAKAMKGPSAKTAGKSVVNIHSKLKVKRPKAELYSYWRNLENLPSFMSHIQEVEEIDNKMSHWVAEIPGGFGTIEWDAEIIWEEQNHLLSWRSLPGSEIQNSGEVRFEDASGGKSTFVETTISYRPPAGEVGGLAAKLLNPGFKKVVENDLQEFKKIMEKGRGRR